MLQTKNAVIYGAGGSLGSAVAKAFARAGATVFLSGRNLASVQKIADAIKADGGRAHAAVVDALDANAVDQYLKSVQQQAGTIDISYNAIDWQPKQDVPLIEMPPEDFVRPVQIAMQTLFITGTAVAKIMKQQKSGCILSLTATPGGIGYPEVGGFGPACSAVESFSRNLASELGIFGVRVVNIRSAGSPDSRVFAEAIQQGGEAVEFIINQLRNDTMLKRMPLMQDIANVATFLASDAAGMITGVTVDVTGGTTSALNYKVSDDQKRFIPFT
jgi:NAD(P)-dependent dehydrogenase (short-subunit alcohol dehydrogenase family)